MKVLVRQGDQGSVLVATVRDRVVYSAPVRDYVRAGVRSTIAITARFLADAHLAAQKAAIAAH